MGGDFLFLRNPDFCGRFVTYRWERVGVRGVWVGRRGKGLGGVGWGVRGVGGLLCVSCMGKGGKAWGLGEGVEPWGGGDGWGGGWGGWGGWFGCEGFGSERLGGRVGM